MTTTMKEHFVDGMSFDDERLAQRRKTIGASDIGAIAGLDPHRSALDVFCDKRGLVPPFEGNEFTMWGLLLEEPIARRYGVKHAVAFEQVGTLVHPTETYISATPDRIVVPAGADRYPLEIKNKSVRQAVHFGEPGTDQVPFLIGAQVHWQMVVLRAHGYAIDFADVAVLFGGNDYRDYRVPFVPKVAEQMQEIAHAFWTKHVLTGDAPAPDGSERAHQWLAETFRTHTDVLLDATSQDESAMRRLKIVRAEKAKLEADEQQLAATLKARIGDAAGIQGRGWRITWKKTADQKVTDWKAVATELGGTLKDVAEAMRSIGEHALADDLANAFMRSSETHTSVRDGSRRFLPVFPREDA